MITRVVERLDEASMRAIDRVVPDCVLRTLGYGVFAVAAVCRLIGIGY